MLPLAENRGTATLVSLDPGTTHLGVAVLRFDIRTLELRAITAWSLDANKIPSSEWSELIHGSRFRRIEVLKKKLLEIFRVENPVVVATEAPFFNPRQPNAFEALVEALSAIQQALYRYDAWLPLTRVSPSEVKNAAGAAGGVGKEPVKEALMRNAAINQALTIPLEKLDEHAVDAIGVGLFVMNHLRKTLPLLE